MRKIITCFLMMVIAIGCLSAKSKKTTELKYVGLKVYDPVYIAKDKGFFEKEGISVKIVDTVAGGATAAQMVSNGSVNGGLLSNMAIANAVGNGLPIIAVADIQSAFNNALLEEFFVRKDSGIKTMQDLKGKKIAINLIKSSFHYTWLIALKNAGMSPEDVIFVNIPFAQQEEALVKGNVDAIGLMQPYTKSARSNEKLGTLFTATDIFGERQFCEIIMNKVWCENNPALAEKFVSAIAKATEWVKSNQNEAKEIISKYTGIDKAFIDDYYFQPNGSVNIADAEYWLKYMQDNEGVATWVKVEDVATNKYNKAVK